MGGRVVSLGSAEGAGWGHVNGKCKKVERSLSEQSGLSLDLYIPQAVSAAFWAGSGRSSEPWACCLSVWVEHAQTSLRPCDFFIHYIKLQIKVFGSTGKIVSILSAFKCFCLSYVCQYDEWTKKSNHLWYFLTSFTWLFTCTSKNHLFNNQWINKYMLYTILIVSVKL